jgi:hypothetical protein
MNTGAPASPFTPLAAYTLWCLLEDGTAPFAVLSPTKLDLHHFKKLVLIEGFGHQASVAAHQLVLKQVSHCWTAAQQQLTREQIKEPIVLKPLQHALNVVRSLGDHGFVELIEPMDILSDIYSDPPPAGRLHIFVQVRPAGEDQSLALMIGRS